MKHKTCHRCHCQLDSEDAITFRDFFLCEDCFDSQTTVCDCCGGDLRKFCVIDES